MYEKTYCTSKSILAQISIVFSSEMLLKRKSISRLPLKNSESCSTISSAKTNEYFTVYLLLVKDFKIGTRNFANLYVGLLIAGKIGRKGRQLWPIFS